MTFTPMSLQGSLFWLQLIGPNTKDAMPKSAKKKSIPLHKRQFLLEPQLQLHRENPALRTLLYLMLSAMVVLIGLLYIQGRNVGMW